jgi:hypothetical protein
MSLRAVQFYEVKGRTVIDLRPLAISRWENEGGAVPQTAAPGCHRTLTPLRRRVLLTPAQIADAV